MTFKASGSANKAHAAVWASFDLQDDDQHGLLYANDNSYGNEFAMGWEQQTNARTTKRDKGDMVFRGSSRCDLRCYHLIFRLFLSQIS